jgi:hypothetical protein
MPSDGQKLGIHKRSQLQRARAGERRELIRLLLNNALFAIRQNH